MADRYISKEWLLQTLEQYKNLKTWNESVCDLDTVSRVLQVLENVVNNVPNIGPRQYGRKAQEVKNAALQFQLTHLKKLRQYDDEQYVVTESVGNVMLMGFYKGRIQIEEQVIDWLERMVQNG